MTAVRMFLNWNKQVSASIQDLLDNLVPRDRGWEVFTEQTLPSILKRNTKVLDVGGGKRPLISLEQKKKLNLTVIGMDIDEEELAQAPKGSYDGTIVGDIEQVDLHSSYDLIFSCAVMEHVKNPEAAIKNMGKALTPDGIMAHFVPCRHALFASINRYLGPKTSKKILLAFHPDKATSQGFPSYYQDCLPSKFAQFYKNEKLDIITLEMHYASDYATFFFPFYLAEALRQIVVKLAKQSDFAETFTIIGKKGN